MNYLVTDKGAYLTIAPFNKLRGIREASLHTQLFDKGIHRNQNL